LAISINVQDVEANKILRLFRFIHYKWQQTGKEFIRRYFYLVKAFRKVQIHHLSKVRAVNADHVFYVLSEVLLQQDSNAVNITAWHNLA
jgi:hypothetical protein